MTDSLKIFVPRFMDAINYNPQNLNAKAILARSSPNHSWFTSHYYEPAKTLRRLSQIKLHKLISKRLWRWHLFLLYQKNYDVIFYPGVEAYDYFALRLRKALDRTIPLISTLEGLLGNEDLEKKFSEWAGHPVYSQRVNHDVLKRADYIYRQSKHIIAISPLTEKIGKLLYGNKISFLPLGVDRHIFYPAKNKPSLFTVVGSGRLYENKQPLFFLDMAENFPHTQFIWYGDGEQRNELLKQIKERNLSNVSFPGSIPNNKLAEAFRQANVFVLPSLAEGSPKVVQEAVACGLPVILFGFYEPTSVIDNYNGFIVWDRESFLTKLEELILHPTKARKMGKAGLDLAISWDWDKVAPLWENKIIDILHQ